MHGPSSNLAAKTGHKTAKGGHEYLYCQSSDHLGNAVKMQFRRCISSIQSNSKAFCSAVNTGSAIDVTAVNLRVT